jgi:polysaccharide export outer membrane protein
MKKIGIILIVGVFLAMIATSCVTAKKVRYLSDMPKEGMPINENFEVTVSPYDELAISVLSNGNEEELLKPFNAFSGVTYLVDGNGNIQFPVLGELHVEGLTRLQLQDTLCTRLVKEGHLKSPMAQVKFMNFRVFFLNSSGGYVVNVENERCTFLEALAMSGGLDYYTRRDRIGVMREVNGKRIVHYLDPRSTAIFDDEFFLLQQNDIIFTEESRFSFFKENMSSWALVLSFLTSLTSLGMVYVMAKSLSTK